MQQDPIETVVESNLLTMNAMIEAARGGESGCKFSQLADALREFSLTLGQSDLGAYESVELSAAEQVQMLERRYATVEQLLDRLPNIGAQILSTAQQTTAAIRSDDQQSDVVAFSSVQADYLRELVAQIELQQRELATAVAGDRREIKSMIESCNCELVVHNEAASAK